MLVCISFLPPHTGPRVRRAPGLPCALHFRARKSLAKLGHIRQRDREGVFFCHCERSETIRSGAKTKKKWIASLLSQCRGESVRPRTVCFPARYLPPPPNGVLH